LKKNQASANRKTMKKYTIRTKGMALIALLIMLPQVLWAQTEKKSSFTLVIDPGHGGKDPGTEKRCETCLHEKDLALVIALKVGSLLENFYKNIRVVYTRKTDKYLSLEERTDLANASEADCFISIHCNSNPKKEIYGTQTHIETNSPPDAKRLAALIDDHLTDRAMRKSLGIFDSEDRRFNLFVLRKITMPGVLVEAGFLSNSTEEKFLNTDQGQSVIANAIFKAMQQYLQDSKYQMIPRVMYRVQVMASHKKIPLNHSLFKSLGMPIEELTSKESDDLFPFKYTVGKKYELADINALVEIVRKRGFENAFILTFKN
jgi:N-acetylmuramoyl-L-alanine amidase